jgi:phenylacetate-CoA ligase
MLELLRFIYHVRKYNAVMKLSPERILAIQDQKFRELLRHAHQNSEYYREKFKGKNLETCRLQDLPILTKNDMMNHFENFVTDKRLKRQPIIDFMSDFGNMGKYYLNEFVVSHTSGSQGQAAVIVQHKDGPFHLFAMQVARGHAMPKTWGTVFKKLFKRRSRWAMILFKPCFIPSGSAFGYMPQASRKLADMLRLNLSDPFEVNLRKLDEFQPNYITAYVHVLEQLARAAKNGQTTIASKGNLELVVAISEPLPPETQKFIETNLGVPVANHYAMGECPQLSLGCPLGHGAHINNDMAILENVDANYNPVPDGTPGAKVLMTNLMNFVQPIIRYEIDDVITLSSDPCPCGNKLPRIVSIAGRSNDQFWVVSDKGETLEMSNLIFKDAFLLLFDIAEFQVTQTGKNQFSILVEVIPGSTLTTDRMRHAIHEVLNQEDVHISLDCNIQIVPRIPHDSKSGKLRRFINKAGAPSEKPVGIVGLP